MSRTTPIQQSTTLIRAIEQAGQGYSARPQQECMSREIAVKLARPVNGEARRILAVEAPTGVGKTFAYLAGVLPAAIAANKKVVLATATTNLQQQLVETDLQRFIELTGLGFSYALAKGRGRYVCPTLPRPRDLIYVVDEAHQLPSKALDQTAARCNVGHALGITQHALRLLDKLPSLLVDKRRLIARHPVVHELRWARRSLESIDATLKAAPFVHQLL